MSHLRLELRLTLVAYVGDDVTPESTPERDPDAVEAFRLVRTIPLGGCHRAHEVAHQHFPGMMAGVTPVITENLRHSLRLQGH